MDYLVCRHCGNTVGEMVAGAVVISVKIRGQRRRSYRVSAISLVTCDWCSKEGAPISRLEFQVQREA